MIFGVCGEGLPQQINYLIDEGMSSGKGSNMVISHLHNFLENYGLGEKIYTSTVTTVLDKIKTFL